MNSGSISDCCAIGGRAYGDAIYSSSSLYLPPSAFSFLTIELPNGLDNAIHNTNPDDVTVMGYVGIYSTKSATENPNRKIEFADSESKPLDGSVFGKTGDEISVPDSVPNRSGYKFALSYINNSEKTLIDLSDDGKFTLTQGMLDTAANGVIKVYVNYDKLYTEQYFNHSDFVGIIRKKRA